MAQKLDTLMVLRWCLSQHRRSISIVRISLFHIRKFRDSTQKKTLPVLEQITNTFHYVLHIIRIFYDIMSPSSFNIKEGSILRITNENLIFWNNDEVIWSWKNVCFALQEPCSTSKRVFTLLLAAKSRYGCNSSSLPGNCAVYFVIVLMHCFPKHGAAFFRRIMESYDHENL